MSARDDYPALKMLAANFPRYPAEMYRESAAALDEIDRLRDQPTQQKEREQP